MIPISIEKDKIPLLQGANAKFSANVDVISPDDPIPVSATAIAAASFSADDKVAIGNDVALGVSAKTSVILAALFKEQLGGAPDLATEFNLGSSLNDDNFLLALDIGGKADLSVCGSYKYSVLSATASLDAGVDARLVNTLVFDNRAEPSKDVLEKFIRALTTPGTLKEPPLPGQVTYLEFGGYLNFGASLSSGFEMKGTHDFSTVSALKLSECYRFSATGKLSLTAKLAGRFSVQAQSAADLHPADPGWTRVIVKRQRARDLQIKADISVGAELDTAGLPPTGKEFLGSLLGLRAKNWINLADSILNQAGSIKTAADLTTRCDALARIYLSTLLHKPVDQLDPPELKTLLDNLKAVVDSYSNVGDGPVALFDRYFSSIDGALKPALAKIEALASLNELQGLVDPVLLNVAQQLTGGNLLDVILDNATGLKMLRDAAAKVVSLIENSENQQIRDFIALARNKFDLDKIIDELAKFDTLDKLKAQASEVAQHVVERILGISIGKLSKSDFKDLTSFIQELQKGKKGFFDKFDAFLKEAVRQKCTAEIGLCYDNADENDALIDVDIRLQNADGSHNPKGLAFMAQAGLGNFSDILKSFDPVVLQLRAGTLTHNISTSNGVSINIAGWHQNFQYQDVRKVVLNADRQIRSTLNGMLHVFTNVDMMASHDRTFKTNRHEQEMHAAFVLRLIAESTTSTMEPKERDYLLDVVTATAATYTNKLVDNLTTQAKLDRILLLAKDLGLDGKGATMPALAPVLQSHGGNFGAVEAEYLVRFSEAGLSNLFRAPGAVDAGPVDEGAIRSILRAIVVSNYVGTGLEPVAALYCSDVALKLARDNPNGFRDVQSTLDNAGDLLIQNPFPGLPLLIRNTKEFRILAATLFAIERSLINAFTALHNAVQKGHISLDELEIASKHFGDALNAFDSQTDLSQGTSNPMFAVFDRLIQLATPAAQARDSALALKLGPADAQKTILFQLVADQPAAGRVMTAARS